MALFSPEEIAKNNTLNKRDKQYVPGAPVPMAPQRSASAGVVPQAKIPQAPSSQNYREMPWQDQLGLFQKDNNLASQELGRATDQANLYKATGATGDYNRAQTWIGQINTATGGRAQLPKPVTAAATPNPAMQQYQQYQQQLNEAMGQLKSFMQPMRYDPNTDPQAVAYKQFYDNLAKQGSQNAMEAMNDRGLLNSSMTAGEIAKAQQDANLAFGTKVADLGSQFYQNQQNQINNATRLVGLLGDLQQRGADNAYRDRAFDADEAYRNKAFDADQKYRDKQLGIQEAGLTGSYMPEGARDIINNILSLKQQAEQQGVTPEQMANFKKSADEQRAALARMGIDPSMVGFEQGYDQASQNAANYRGIPTLQGQNQQFNQGMANREQNLRETTTMASLTGMMPDGRPTTAEQQRQLENEWKTALATGRITPTLAKMYNIPENSPTMDAQKLAAQVAHQNAQLDISRMNAGTSAFNARTSRMNAERQAKSAADKAANKNTFDSDYNEFLTDLPRISTRDEGLALVDIYRQDGIPESVLQKMIKDLNAKFNKVKKE